MVFQTLKENELPKYPPEGKVRWKATYKDPGQSPFAATILMPTKTADVDEAASKDQVEQWAREAGEGLELVSVEVVEE